MAEPKLEAHDPNTSPERLLELLSRYTKEVLANPSIPLILLENPGWLNNAKMEHLLKLLLQPELPEQLVNALTLHPDSTVADTARMHVALGEGVTDWEPLLQNLAALKCYQHDRKIMERHGIVPEWLKPYLEPLPAPLPESPGSAEGAEGIEAPGPFTEEQKAILRTESDRYLGLRARRSDSAEEIEFILSLAPDTAPFAAANPATPLFLLKRLMETPRYWRSLAANTALPLEMLTDLFTLAVQAKDSSPLVGIALNPNCSPELAACLREEEVPSHHLARFYSHEELEELFLSGQEWAAWHASTRDHAPKWLVAERLTRDTLKRHNLLPWFCGLLDLNDQKRLMSNARSKDWYTRFAIVLNSSTPRKSLEKLANDSNRYIRFAAKARLCDTAWVFPPAISREG